MLPSGRPLYRHLCRVLLFVLLATLAAPFGVAQSIKRAQPLPSGSPRQAVTTASPERTSPAPGRLRLVDRARLERPAVAVEALPVDPLRARVDGQTFALLGAVQAAASKNGPAAREVLEALERRDDLPLHRRSGGELAASVFVRVTTPEAAAQLDALGIVRRTQVGTIVAADVPLASLRALAEHPAVQRVELSGVAEAAMDESRADIRVDAVHQGLDLPQAYQGEGVIVGIVDSGIDVTHPDFLNDDGTTRILYFGEVQPDGSWKEWTKAEIDANPAAVPAEVNEAAGHGTHVTGIAAGGGRANPALRGVAPKADVIVVKANRYISLLTGPRYTDVDELAAVQYIFDRAAELGRPAVVNLSVGVARGPADGTTLFERALTELSGPGRLIVASAGNNGSWTMHVGGDVTLGKWYASLLMSGSVMDLWFDKDAIVMVVLEAYEVSRDGSLTFLGISDWLTVGTNMTEPVPVGKDGRVAGYVKMTSTTEDPQNGDGHVLLEVSDNWEEGTSPWWLLTVFGGGEGRYDAWAIRGLFYGEPLGIGDDHTVELPGNSESTIWSPASADGVISVGNHITRNTWTDVDGNFMEGSIIDDGMAPAHIGPALPLGTLSRSSSRGPLRDGRTAPHLTAPGEFILAPLATGLTEGLAYRREQRSMDGRYVLWNGTSMAAPHVAGTIALMLQANPGLDHAEVLEILQSTARTDVTTGTVPNNDYGAGRLDAYAAVQEVVRRSGTEGGSSVVLRHFAPEEAQRVWTLDRALPIDSGFVAGTNLYRDRAKATAFTLPDGLSQARLTEVRTWFSYKATGAEGERYRLEIYAGDAASGPVGEPLFSASYALADVRADADSQTPVEATVHTLPRPVTVGRSFFVAVSFGEYGAEGAGRAGLATSDLRGVRVPHVWEQDAAGKWAVLSDAWDFGSGAGRDGVELWIEAVAATGSATDVAEPAELPAAFALEPNYPNPFNPETTIRFALPAPEHARLRVFDVLGREVALLADGPTSAGTHAVRFEADHLPSGVYFYHLEAGSYRETRRMVLAK